MKQLKTRVAAWIVVVCTLATASCNDAGTGSNSGDMNNSNDSATLTETRRNTTDTVNYLSGDSANKSQDAIDPNPPGQ